MKKEEILEVLKKESYRDGTNDLVLYESEFEFVAERLVKLCNLQNVSNNEVAVCETCLHYRKDNTSDICRRCFSNSHFSKAN